LQVELEALQLDLCAAAQAFRLAREAEGADALVRAIDGLAGAFGRLPPERTRRVAAALQAALAAQGRADWIGLADELEHVLAVALRDD
jgi:hypothetical protein